MFDSILEAYSVLEKIREKSKEIIVFYSGGKDSIVTLDMCTKVFSRVVAVYMYFVKGLNLIENQLDFARERYKVEIRQIPHWSMIKALKDGVYCHSRPEFDNFPDMRIRDCYDVVMADTGIQYIATGAKKTDSRYRSQYIEHVKGYQFLVLPLKNWNRYDVLYYLKKENIPLPDSSGADMSGVGLAVRDVLWLYDKHYTDFLKLEKVFPFVRTIVKRREYYGIK